MHLIHAFVDHNDLKAKFLNQLNLPTGCSPIKNREQIHALDVWHLMADKWNDKSFELETVTMQELHMDFTVANMTPATAEKVEDKWSAVAGEVLLHCKFAKKWSS